MILSSTVSDTDQILNTKTARESELLAHLAEYDALQREHELLQKMRQELGVYTLAATVALVGAFIGQVTLLSGNATQTIFLVMPIFFTLMTWWYIRTNYSAAVIELYVLKILSPKLSALTKTSVLNWLPFLYRVESSATGKIVLVLQTLSRVGLIQGPAFLCIIVYGIRGQWHWNSWPLRDKILMISNVAGFLISFGLSVITSRIVRDIVRLAKITPPSSLLKGPDQR